MLLKEGLSKIYKLRKTSFTLLMMRSVLGISVLINASHFFNNHKRGVFFINLHLKKVMLPSFDSEG